MSAYLCPNCGFNNPPGMRFCGSCGARLAGVTGSLELKAPAPIAVPDQIGVMMGADLVERFRQAGLEAAGQRRNVTILFVDLTSFTSLSQEIDDEEIYLLIQQYINVLVKDVYRYDGMVDKFMGDGLMAIFGAPIAHENTSELAIRSALDMQSDMRQFSQELQGRLGRELRLHIGLHTGPVIVGSIGSKLMMNYTAIGDTVNLASRLEEKCPPGEILASEAVYQATRALFEFARAAPLTLNGYLQPVSGYRVIGERAQPG
ncbi:MAG TPA: adenylate/guanylate cyclase domain-containing protein, partial [Anaerolineaceae bacterium]|nr:adenylate/guanylate cyclase domain-containing protein [Anaerolineaceae bacterium]